MIAMPPGVRSGCESLISPRQFYDRINQNLDTHIGINTIYALVEKKNFPSLKIGRQYYIIESEVKNWMGKEMIKIK